MSIESRIREMKRRMLHQRYRVIRGIWREHIIFLEGRLSKSDK